LYFIIPYIYDEKGEHEINEMKSQKYHAPHLISSTIGEKELLNSGVWDVTLKVTVRYESSTLMTD